MSQIPEGVVPMEQIHDFTLRWQIEIIFKRGNPYFKFIIGKLSKRAIRMSCVWKTYCHLYLFFYDV